LRDGSQGNRDADAIRGRDRGHGGTAPEPGPVAEGRAASRRRWRRGRRRRSVRRSGGLIMSEAPRDDPRARLDVRIDSPGREGLAGTAPAELYLRRADREHITIAPDFRPPDAQPAWRQDFPIDWPQDRYVERRDFVKFLVLISGAFVAGQFWIATQNWWRRRGGQDDIRRVASVNDIAVGGTMVFRYPGEHDPC